MKLATMDVGADWADRHAIITGQKKMFDFEKFILSAKDGIMYHRYKEHCPLWEWALKYRLSIAGLGFS